MNRTFHVRTKIISGAGSLAALPAELSALPASRWALVADAGIAQAGLLDLVTQQTGEARIAVTHLVSPNPGLAAVAAAAEEAAAGGCDGVLAAGGGSALCAAKAVAILLTNPGPVDRYEGVGLVPRRPAPTIAIPTTAGSGSEVSNALVLHEPGRPREVVVRGPGCDPDVALLDGTLLRGLPEKPMIDAALDALTHALEAQWVRGRSTFTDALARHAAGMICSALPKALSDRDDDVLQDLMEASCAANLACGNSGLGLVHALTSSPQVPLPHGYQNGALLLQVARFNEGLLGEQARRHIAAAAALYEAIGRDPRFQPADTRPSYRDSILAAADGHPFRANNIRPATDDDILRLLDEAGVAAPQPS
ncbi:MAG TPA: iron-containing alcohol dehydrogenase [Trebonia sp.]|nr:iron-containing alcohol dehydrogenase [Trebonia sp.]